MIFQYKLMIVYYLFLQIMSSQFLHELSKYISGIYLKICIYLAVVRLRHQCNGHHHYNDDFTVNYPTSVK